MYREEEKKMNLNLTLKNEQKKQVNFELYESTHATLKELSKKYDVSIQNLVIHAINNVIEALTK